MVPLELALGVHRHRRDWHYLVADLVQRYQLRSIKSITKAELDYIRDGGGLVDGDAPVKRGAPADQSGLEAGLPP